YTLDSAELPIGAVTLGFVHSPGYPLYLIIAHLFTLLPFGDVAYRVNLFSALSLALSAPILYCLLHELIKKRWIAFCTTLIFMWSYYVWGSGLVSEIYAPQIITAAAGGWALAVLYNRRQFETRFLLLTGVFVGVAVAMAPSSVLLTPGVLIGFVALRI